MQLTRHGILSMKVWDSAAQPPLLQHCCLGGKHTGDELSPLYTSEIEEGNANSEKAIFQHQMQVCLGQPCLKLTNKNYFSTAYI